MWVSGQNHPGVCWEESVCAFIVKHLPGEGRVQGGEGAPPEQALLRGRIQTLVGGCP